MTEQHDPGDRRRLDEEIAHYRDCVNVHDLPAIYHVWSNRYVLPKLVACGYEEMQDFYLQPTLRACRAGPDRVAEVVGIGSGNCDIEIELALRLRREGVDNFRFRCVEINPHMVARGKELARQHDLEDFFSFEVGDVDAWHPDRPVSVCMASHSLHHIVHLEELFAKVGEALETDGVFLVNDMIGRNGHQRWPEALRVVERIWDGMPDRYKYNHQLQRVEPEFVNWDCSTEGNEGIRAQDILPLLMERFHFETFVAFANVIDVFVDRSFGHNFNPDDPADVAFIEEVARRDEALLDAGTIKPTHLIAVLRNAPVEQLNCYRHWTPEFCVRHP